VRLGLCRWGRALRDLGVIGADGKPGKSGAVTVVQRTNADLLRVVRVRILRLPRPTCLSTCSRGTQISHSLISTNIGGSTPSISSAKAAKLSPARRPKPKSAFSRP